MAKLPEAANARCRGQRRHQCFTTATPCSTSTHQYQTSRLGDREELMQHQHELRSRMKVSGHNPRHNGGWALTRYLSQEHGQRSNKEASSRLGSRAKGSSWPIRLNRPAMLPELYDKTANLYLGLDCYYIACANKLLLAVKCDT